jgi:hypothetical protein
MKKNNGFLRIAPIALIGAILVFASCKDEDRLTGQDTQDIIEEATTDTYFQDMDDMAGVAIESPSDDEFSSGRSKGTITIQDDRLNCSGVVVSIMTLVASTKDHPRGIITVDFGLTGCQDARGNIRTGLLSFTYDGRRFQPQSTIVVKATNYAINGVKIEGTRTLTNVTGSTDQSPKFHAVLEDGKATFPDGSVATRESDITWQWNRSSIGMADDELVINPASASGTTRGGRTYTVTVLEALKYKRACGIAVDGIKKYVLDNSKEVIIDYGNGTCDKAVTITVNGTTRNLSVN